MQLLLWLHSNIDGAMPISCSPVFAIFIDWGQITPSLLWLFIGKGFKLENQGWQCIQSIIRGPIPFSGIECTLPLLPKVISENKEKEKAIVKFPLGSKCKGVLCLNLMIHKQRIDCAPYIFCGTEIDHWVFFENDVSSCIHKVILLGYIIS